MSLSIDDVAQATGVEYATVLKIETEPHSVSLNDLYAVANFLNLDPGLVLELLHFSARQDSKL